MANDEELCDSIQIAPKKLKEPANIFLEIKNPDKLLKNNNFGEEEKKVCPKNLIRDCHSGYITSLSFSPDGTVIISSVGTVLVP